MKHQPPPRDFQPRRGFTLIELLTVIAIIVILIGILLPVISAVRKSAYQAATQATISNLVSAIERYRSDFNAYPGPLSEADVFNGLGVTGGGLISTTENMVLGLVGGWEPGSGYVVDRVGLGPMSHNPVAASRRRWPAYIDAVEGSNFPLRPFTRWGQSTSPPASPGNESVIPEFMDQFPDPLPILYVRARLGMPKTNVNNTFDAPYDYRALTLWYQRPPSANGAFKGDFLMTQTAFNADPDDFPSWDEYFHDPNIGTPNTPTTYVARQKDSFWLIAAGPDRRYGTRDDQTNFGGFR